MVARMLEGLGSGYQVGRRARLGGGKGSGQGCWMSRASSVGRGTGWTGGQMRQGPSRETPGWGRSAGGPEMSGRQGHWTNKKMWTGVSDGQAVGGGMRGRGQRPGRGTGADSMMGQGQERWPLTKAGWSGGDSSREP